MRTRLLAALPSVVVTSAGALLIGAEVFSAVVDGSQGVLEHPRVWGIAIVFGAVGWVVASRHPRNPIGWLLLAACVSAGLESMAATYAQHYADTGDGPDLLGGIAAKYGDAGWIPFIVLPTTFLLALFPNGHLLSPRWRSFVWCAAIGMVGNFLASILTAGPSEDYPSIDNPIGIDSPVVDPVAGLSLLLVGIGIVGSAVSLVLRFRRSRGSERQQLKLLALAGAVAGLTIMTCIPLYDHLGEGVADGLMMSSVMGLPVAAGVAILRYRLYDIDVVINRTLVYGSLTASLAAVYLGSVLLLQILMNPWTEGSSFAIAVSTLVTAAVVRPGRARIQAVVDRRFFRRKYDAARTLETFGGHLRQQVDLETLRGELRRAVVTTMQPAHLSLWTPSDGGGR